MALGGKGAAGPQPCPPPGPRRPPAPGRAEPFPTQPRRRGCPQSHRPGGSRPPYAAGGGKGEAGGTSFLCRHLWDQHHPLPVFFSRIRGDLTSQELQFCSLFVRLQVPKQNCTVAVLNTALLIVTSPAEVWLCHRIKMAEELTCCLQTQLLASAMLPTCAYSIGVFFCFFPILYSICFRKIKQQLLQ